MLNGISGVERYGWIPPSSSPLLSVYRVDVVDDGGLILFSFVFLSMFLYWMTYSRKGGVKCCGQSRTGRVELGNYY